jgi:hypothetical protein
MQRGLEMDGGWRFEELAAHVTQSPASSEFKLLGNKQPVALRVGGMQLHTEMADG